MSHPANIGSWGELYVMLGTSSAALIGLLFVATSLHVEEIVNNTIYRTLARSSSIYLLATLAEAACVLAPQPAHTLGIEIAVLNLVALVVVSRNFFYFLNHPDVSQQGGLRIYRGLTFIVAFLTGIAGGVALIAGKDWALYPVSASYVVVIVAVALTAWSVMLGVGHEGKKEKKNGRARRNPKS
jgi:hypothetical protein